MAERSDAAIIMAAFEPAIEYVLANEGGYNPNDTGSPSNFGIRQADHPGLDVQSLTRDEAINIYEVNYWRFGGLTSQRVATKLLDVYVNLDHTGIRILQQALSRLLAGPVVCDGVWGPITEAQTNAADESALIDELKFQLVKHYENADPSQRDGLLRRAVKG